MEMGNDNFPARFVFKLTGRGINGTTSTWTGIFHFFLSISFAVVV
jgi:hypothetical protein